ncbi:hypothetical protein [Vitiosangium sp. GDMCC 1.1324]|uniref:hypothetical protein n=1 Tax=Vitiosangium sp. (strain GDMCC 1.1324) TaxID=2138576 RepID=UPI000D3408A9|nr:hypothetical protein [Vitiosangium sp. GDMCC 1.1324]PTL77498.1 hypothetical protein DAT35_44700 [Vitiosangium sp. GDMCC 1.1324]
MRIRWFPLVTGLLLATAAAADPPLPRAPTDKIDIEVHEDALELSWSDTEERLQGSILPAVPREGQPLRVNLQVGSFEGAPFEGPLILTLREAGANHGQSLTVPRTKGHWEATFTPEHDGPYLLDISFRTTRHKSLHAAFEVATTQVPRMIGWGVLGLGCLALLGYTVRSLIKGDQPEERTRPLPADEPAPPEETPSAPAAATPVVDTPPVPGTEAPPATEPPAALTLPAPGSEAPPVPPASPPPAEPPAVGAAPSSSTLVEAENKPPADQ